MTDIADVPEGLFATDAGQSHSLELKELGAVLVGCRPTSVTR